MTGNTNPLANRRAATTQNPGVAGESMAHRGNRLMADEFRGRMRWMDDGAGGAFLVSIPDSLDLWLEALQKPNQARAFEANVPMSWRRIAVERCILQRRDDGSFAMRDWRSFEK